MKALRWHGKEDVRIDTVPDPKIEDGRDIVIKITATAICGSDLHLYDGYQPGMEPGDILGHEAMGVVVETGSAITNLKQGDRVVIPFTIACGQCFFCQKGLFAACDRSNPNKEVAEKLMGHSPSGCFGFSHILGGIPGGQAEYLRVPYADVGALKIESDLSDEQARSSPTSSRQVTWPPNVRRSSPATRWRCGAAALLARWRFAVRGCMAPDA